MLSKLFSNYLKIIKIKDQDCVEFHIENITIKNKPDQYFFTAK